MSQASIFEAHFAYFLAITNIPPLCNTNYIYPVSTNKHIQTFSSSYCKYPLNGKSYVFDDVWLLINIEKNINYAFICFNFPYCNMFPYCNITCCNVCFLDVTWRFFLNIILISCDFQQQFCAKSKLYLSTAPHNGGCQFSVLSMFLQKM